MGFLPKLQKQSAFRDYAWVPRCISYLYTEILALQPFPHEQTPTAIRFGLRESRLAYLGSFRFVLLRYSCCGNTRSEIQVSSRERSRVYRRSQSRDTDVLSGIFLHLFSNIF